MVKNYFHGYEVSVTFWSFQTKAELATRAMYTIVWGKKNDERELFSGEMGIIYNKTFVWSLHDISLYL